MALIAKVVVVAMVDGQRKTFNPGETLPDMHRHDAAQLIVMGSAEDTEATAAAEKAAQREAKAAAKPLAEAKAARAAAKASRQTGTPPAGGDGGEPKPDDKKEAK